MCVIFDSREWRTRRPDVIEYIFIYIWLRPVLFSNYRTLRKSTDINIYRDYSKNNYAGIDFCKKMVTISSFDKQTIKKLAQISQQHP